MVFSSIYGLDSRIEEAANCYGLNPDLAPQGRDILTLDMTIAE